MQVRKFDIAKISKDFPIIVFDKDFNYIEAYSVHLFKDEVLLKLYLKHDCGTKDELFLYNSLNKQYYHWLNVVETLVVVAEAPNRNMFI